MKKTVGLLVALLLIAGIVGGVKATSGGSDKTPSSSVAAPRAATVTTVTANTAQSSPVASPMASPSASPVAGTDCTGIADWFARVQERVAPLDAFAVQIQTQEQLESLSLEQVTQYLETLKDVRAEQQNDIPASAGNVAQSALLMLLDREITQFEAVIVAINNGDDVGAVYAANLGPVSEATQMLSAATITVGFACIDEF